MNRFSVELIAGGRRVSDRVTIGGDDDLGLFSRDRASTGIAGGGPISPVSGSADHKEGVGLGRISVGTSRIERSGMEVLLDAEIGKHDYDWLLTPPETPQFTSSVAKDIPLSSTQRGRTAGRSVSNTRPSRLSASQTENGHSTRQVRSSSVTRPSFSNNYSSSSFSNFSNNNRTSILNTSSASVTSSRPSTPVNRSTTSGRSSTISATARSSTTSTTARPSITPAIAKTSTTSKPIASRLPTPTKTRPTTSTSGITRPSHNSRPSTPTSSRPQTPSNPKPSLNPRPTSRASTPSRRPTTPAAASAAPAAGGRYPSVGRIPAANSRNQAASTSRPSSPGPRPSSPGPRPRAPVRPIDLPDFPNYVPPNLRTNLPERPASAGRMHPGMSLTLRTSPNSEAVVPTAAAPPVNSSRRTYLPVVSRSKFPETANKLQSSNGHEAAPEIQKPTASDAGVRRPIKPASATESTGFGRNISKKSLDMALRHMDIRQGMGGIRASSLFPQSIRSATANVRPARKSDPVVPLASDEFTADNGRCNGTHSPAYNGTASENGDSAVTKSPGLDMDVNGSSRYDAFMLKEEDSKNMSWLHSVEDKSDQSPVFDHRFEPLPEPFGLL